MLESKQKSDDEESECSDTQQVHAAQFMVTKYEYCGVSTQDGEEGSTATACGKASAKPSRVREVESR